MPNKNLFISPKISIFHEFAQKLAQDKVFLDQKHPFLSVFKHKTAQTYVEIGHFPGHWEKIAKNDQLFRNFSMLKTSYFTPFSILYTWYNKAIRPMNQSQEIRQIIRR